MQRKDEWGEDCGGGEDGGETLYLKKIIIYNLIMIKINYYLIYFLTPKSKDLCNKVIIFIYIIKYYKKYYIQNLREKNYNIIIRW